MSVRISCSVVSGSDPTAIGKFARSFAESVTALRVAQPEVQIDLIAIVNDGDALLARELEALCDCVVLRPAPLGFAANHNEILRIVESDFHVIANDDVVVHEDTISSLITVMNQAENQDVAVISPLLRNPDGSLQPSTYSFPTVSTVFLSWLGLREHLPHKALSVIARTLRPGAGKSRFWAHDRECSVDTLRGAFVLVRMSAVAEVGEMSEVCLVGGEETEWHARLQRSGWRVLFTPRTSVTHIGRVTTGNRPDLDVEYLKGVVNYFAQHGRRWQFTAVRLGARAKTKVIAWRYHRQEGRHIPLYGRPVSQMVFREP